MVPFCHFNISQDVCAATGKSIGADLVRMVSKKERTELQDSLIIVEQPLNLNHLGLGSVVCVFLLAF